MKADIKQLKIYNFSKDCKQQMHKAAILAERYSGRKKIGIENRMWFTHGSRNIFFQVSKTTE
jgi:hypothetical protein